MTDAGAPPADDDGQPPRAVTSPRFTFDESREGLAPSRAKWLRDWWWSGTRTERWAAALGAPLSLLLLLATCTALNSDGPAQTVASRTTTERPTAGTTSPRGTPTPTQTQSATVTTIMSGDTVVVLREGGLETVRLIGIDAPEVAGSAAGLQCWAVESLRFASDALLQQEVRLVSDPTQGEVDSSGATIAYVLLPDGRDFSVLSAGAGQARTHTDIAPATKNAEIAAAEQAARTAALGLWGPPCNGGVALPTTIPEPAPTPAPTLEPVPPPAPPPDSGRDPRFHNCQQANRAGYGPYRRGVDPEYHWYNDKDDDGVVCD
ncbi:MAG: thermonuclease family protein [Actinomycetota bacterium]|nr:thermonuclease family protein [Actinomycetota bacterium]